MWIAVSPKDSCLTDYLSMVSQCLRIKWILNLMKKENKYLL